MSTSLMKRRKRVVGLDQITDREREERRTSLLKLEKEINDASGRLFEDFYYVGRRLQEIRAQELYVAENDEDGKPFASWASYCKSNRIGYARRSADQLIRAADYRPVLPEIPGPPSGGNGAGAIGARWSERNMRPLLKLPTKSDARRVAKKVVTRMKKGEKLTAKLVGAVVDEDLGTDRTRAKRKRKLLDATRPGDTLSELCDKLIETRTALEDAEPEFWDEAEKTTPGIVMRLTTEVDLLASFLRS